VPQPRLHPRRCFDAPDPNARVHGDAAFRRRDDGIQVELRDFAEVVAEPREAVEQVGQRLLVGRALAPEAAHQLVDAVVEALLGQAVEELDERRGVLGAR
jgi:hypothetical protein